MVASAGNSRDANRSMIASHTRRNVFILALCQALAMTAMTITITVTALNGEMSMMSIDAQHRVVLPAHFVSYLGLERDIFFVCTNTTIQVWNPDHYVRWTGRDAGPSHNPALNAYLMI